MDRMQQNQRSSLEIMCRELCFNNLKNYHRHPFLLSLSQPSPVLSNPLPQSVFTGYHTSSSNRVGKKKNKDPVLSISERSYRPPTHVYKYFVSINDSCVFAFDGAIHNSFCLPLPCLNRMWLLSESPISSLQSSRGGKSRNVTALE